MLEWAGAGVAAAGWMPESGPPAEWSVCGWGGAWLGEVSGVRTVCFRGLPIGGVLEVVDDCYVGDDSTLWGVDGR